MGMHVGVSNQIAVCDKAFLRSVESSWSPQDSKYHVLRSNFTIEGILALNPLIANEVCVQTRQ